jgi:hypothetical protein
MSASDVIARLRELRAKATAGRLLALPQKPNWDVYWHVTDGEDFVCQLYSEYVEFDNAKANAAAIVAAMDSLDALLECAEALEGLLYHAGIHDADPEDHDDSDHALERKARAALLALGKTTGETNA